MLTLCTITRHYYLKLQHMLYNNHRKVTYHKHAPMAQMPCLFLASRERFIENERIIHHDYVHSQLQER